jgi:hypothetical protein
MYRNYLWVSPLYDNDKRSLQESRWIFLCCGPLGGAKGAAEPPLQFCFHQGPPIVLG